MTFKELSGGEGVGGGGGAAGGVGGGGVRGNSQNCRLFI